MGKNDDFIDGFGLGFHDECDYLNPGLSEFLREMNEIILPEIKFTELRLSLQRLYSSRLMT